MRIYKLETHCRYQVRYNHTWTTKTISQQGDARFYKNLSYYAVNSSNQNKIDWHRVSIFRNLSIFFFEQFSHLMSWTAISARTDIVNFDDSTTLSFINHFKEELSFNLISQNINYYTGKRKHLIEFLDKYKDRVEWVNIILKSNLTEAEIEKYIKYINWDAVSFSKNLTQSFIEKHIEKINFNFALNNVKLTQDFIRKHIDKMPIGKLISTQNVPLDVLKNYLNNNIKTIYKTTYINDICKYQQVDSEFILENYEHINFSALANNELTPKRIKDIIKRYQLKGMSFFILFLNKDLYKSSSYMKKFKNMLVEISYIS